MQSTSLPFPEARFINTLQENADHTTLGVRRGKEMKLLSFPPGNQ
jgi:hypothetical protein